MDWKEKEKVMRICLVVTTLLLVFVVSPAFAEEFCVVQNPSTKKCKISNKKSDGTLMLIGTSCYPTADEAKAARKAAVECQKPKNQ